MSRPYWSTVVGVPSVYSTWPSLSGFGMAMAWPGKYLLYCVPGASVNAGGRIFVAVEDGVDVVGAVLLVLGESIEDEPGKARFVAARLGEHRHVRRQAAAQRGARGLIVRERRREIIGDLAGALEHLALVVRPIGHLEAGGDRRRLRLGEARTAGIGKIAERQKLEAVTGRADLAVDLEAALQLRGIVQAERPGKRPMLPRRRLGLLGGGRPDGEPPKATPRA